jgi:hypothetical protein
LVLSYAFLLEYFSAALSPADFGAEFFLPLLETRGSLLLWEGIKHGTKRKPARERVTAAAL